MTKTAQLKYFATELRYLGKGTVESRNLDGSLIVNIEGMGRGRVAVDMVFDRQRDAFNFARVPGRASMS